MSAEEAHEFGRSRLPPGAAEPGKEKKAEAGNDASVQEEQKPEQAGWGANLFENHKGKLAVGAAAMLGLAVYYKWRDSRLAKDDPEEYARLRRLKAAVGHDEPKAGTKRSGGGKGT